MGRWIDADKLKEHSEIVSYKNEWYETEIDEFVSVENIDSAPSIDICFCRECEHSGVRNDADVWCKKHKLIMRLKDFCSYGERSSE